MSNPYYPINPDRNAPWNNLPELPISPELYQTVEVYEQLGKAKEALGKLYGRSIAIPDQSVLINSISLQEAKASSEIENIFTTDDELYKAFSEQHDEQSEGAVKEVLRYREALWRGYEYLSQNTEFDLAYFIEMCHVVKQTNEGFRPHFAQTYIRQGGSGPNAGTPIYTPPRGKGIIEEKLQNLLTFMNNDEQYPLDPLLKMAIGHFQFEAIHPFRDGNGRTGRIFNIHFLNKKGLLDYPILFLSRYIIQHKNEYYSALARVSQQGDWQNWILYMLKAVEMTSYLTFEKINRIVAAKEDIQRVVEAETDIRRPDQLLNLIFSQPYTKVKHLTDEKLYAENTARSYLNVLSDLGVLEKKSIQGHHYYINLELNSILSD